MFVCNQSVPSLHIRLHHHHNRQCSWLHPFLAVLLLIQVLSLPTNVQGFVTSPLRQVPVACWTLRAKTVQPIDSSSENNDNHESQDTISIAAMDENSLPNCTFHYSRRLYNSQYTQVLRSNMLLPVAFKLRNYWDEHFQDPRQPDGKRFAFDPWFVRVGDIKSSKKASSSSSSSSSSSLSQNHSSLNGMTFSTKPNNNNRDVIPGEQEATKQQIQYSLKRTTPSTFFPPELYDELIDELIQLGKSIGLHAITPPWLSLYTEGDMQHFHTDSPHGRLAFVLYLSQEGDFTGGETIMLQPSVLQYWKNFDGSRGLECGSIIRFIPATKLGRCIAFDPRVPHGVNRVSGTQDPRKGRLAIHGWFQNPETIWFGPWTSNRRNRSNNPMDSEADDTKSKEDGQPLPHVQALDKSIESLAQNLRSGEYGRIVGFLSVRLEIHELGFVEDVLAVCDTLQADCRSKGYYYSSDEFDESESENDMEENDNENEEQENEDDDRSFSDYDSDLDPQVQKARLSEGVVSEIRMAITEHFRELKFQKGPPGRAVVVPLTFE